MLTGPFWGVPSAAEAGVPEAISALLTHPPIYWFVKSSQARKFWKAPGPSVLCSLGRPHLSEGEACFKVEENVRHP